ncbi:MAG: site-specific recombinase [Rhizobacter sp.]|nr:site-specific recombinase [Rhizobacter sp.]
MAASGKARRPKNAGAWDLSALLNAADVSAPLAERHLWLVRLMEWLRHAAVPLDQQPTPTPLLRLRHLLNVLERHPEHQVQVSALLLRFWREVDTAALLADFGFAPRSGLASELGQRVRLRLLPGTPATTNLAELFNLLFPDPKDALWLDQLDAATLARITALLAPHDGTAPADWRTPFFDGMMFLASTVRATGFSPLLRERMSPELLAGTPFRQLARVAEQIREHAESGDTAALLREAQYLRALLDTCRRCALSVNEHLEEHGVSVDVVFEVDQLLRRTHRLEELLTCVMSPEPAPEVAKLVAGLVRAAGERRSLRALFAHHYSMLARKVTERSAETGEHYITRDRAAYRAMLRAAAGGGAVLAGTTFLKFFILAIGLTAFWAGFWAGVNYAASFVLIHLLHFTVATKQPAMTAHVMAEKLTDMSSDTAVEAFVDEVAHLIRSQMAGIAGNLMVVAPLVLAVQFACAAAFGSTPVDVKEAEHVLHTLTLLGPSLLFAAFTGVLLFASSVIAGWVENWFVWHRIDSAIAWNPRIVARLGSARAQRWAAYWRANISGLAANISLGLMLGIVPAVALFFGLPLEVRHVTLSTGQLAAAVGALGPGVLEAAPFWWCLAATLLTGLLNVSVSFFLAFKVALRSRGIRLSERSRIRRAIGLRLRRAPLSFILPPRDRKEATPS